MRAIDWIALGFEIVQCHYAGWKFSAAEAVADFCLHSELIVGVPMTLTDNEPHDLLQQLRTFQVTLDRNGETQAIGSGDKVLGSPLQALAFLVEVLASQPGTPPLQAGEVITTGTMTPILPIQPGECWTAQVSGLDLAKLSIQTK